MSDSTWGSSWGTSWGDSWDVSTAADLAAAEEYHYLADIHLDVTTLHYADEDLVITHSDGTGIFYEGRLPASGVLVRDLGTFLEPKETISTFDLMIDNSDDKMAQLFDTYYWANRRVSMWVGHGGELDDYSEVFRGQVLHPNGLAWDEVQARVTIADRRLRDQRVMPPANDRYTTDTFSKIEQRYRAQPIPIVFGDWSSAAASGVALPVACIDPGELKFQIASHPIKSIDRIMKNISVLAPSQYKNVSLSASTFYLSSIGYDATTDIVSVNCQGWQTANGSLIDNASSILRTINTKYLGISSADMNGTAFHQLATDTNDYKLRRYINLETTSEILRAEIANEVGADLRFVQGRYAPKYRVTDADDERITFYESDMAIAGPTDEKVEFRVERDPDRFYTNRVVAEYEYDPINVRYLNSYTHSVSSEIVNVSSVVERPVTFNWLYRKTDVEDRVQREANIFSREPDSIEVTIASREQALTLNLADQVDFDYSIFTGRPFQIRRIETDLGQMTTRMRALFMFTTDWGIWTLDSATGYTTATATEKDLWGFWTNDEGEALTGNATSAAYHWF